MHTKRLQMLKLQNLFQTHQDHFRDMFSYFHDQSTWISRVMAEKPPKFGQNSEFQNTSWKWTSPSGRRLILSLWHWESSKHTALIKFWTFISRFHWDIYSQIRRFCQLRHVLCGRALLSSWRITIVLSSPPQSGLDDANAHKLRCARSNAAWDMTKPSYLTVNISMKTWDKLSKLYQRSMFRRFSMSKRKN